VTLVVKILALPYALVDAFRRRRVP
jgi:hypothetical protein